MTTVVTPTPTLPTPTPTPTPATAQLLPGAGAPDCVVRTYFLLGSPNAQRPACNGHGQCVAPGTCECEAGWTGRGDTFTGDGYACHNPLVLDKLAWSLVALAWLALFIRSWPSFLKHVKTHRAETSTLRKAGRAHSFDAKRSMAVHVTLMLTMPLMVWAGIHRAASSENFGVDVGVTIPLMAWYLLHFPSVHTVNHLVFKSLVQGALKSHTHDAILKLDDRVGMASAMLTSALQIGLLTAGVVLPRGPTVARAVTAIMHCFVLIFFTMTQFIRAVWIRRRITEVMSVAEQGLAGRPEQAARSERLARVLTHLEENQRGAQVFTIVFIVLGVVFSLPWLLPFAYVYYTFVLVWGTDKANVVHVFSSTPGFGRRPSTRRGAERGRSAAITAPAAAAATATPPTATRGAFHGKRVLAVAET